MTTMTRRYDDFSDGFNVDHTPESWEEVLIEKSIAKCNSEAIEEIVEDLTGYDSDYEENEEDEDEEYEFSCPDCVNGQCSECRLENAMKRKLKYRRTDCKKCTVKSMCDKCQRAEMLVDKNAEQYCAATGADFDSVIHRWFDSEYELKQELKKYRH